MGEAISSTGGRSGDSRSWTVLRNLMRATPGIADRRCCSAGSKPPESRPLELM